ncbi:MAG: hypothetical protein R3A10_09720 [Caldilineaceae bacterium]
MCWKAKCSCSWTDRRPRSRPAVTRTCRLTRRNNAALDAPAALNFFERRYVWCRITPHLPVIGREQDVDAAPFLAIPLPCSRRCCPTRPASTWP